MKLSTLWIKLFAEQINPNVYLEIGVNQAQTFNVVKCKTALGVDPNPDTHGYITRDGYRFFCQTSDEFFDSPAAQAFKGDIDLIFIDGLHTAEQAITDFDNAIRFITNNGWIILHDTWPPDARHTESDRCGTVYKITESVKRFCHANGYDHLTLPWAYGLTIVRRGPCTNPKIQ